MDRARAVALRVARAWRGLGPEHRLAAGAAGALLVTLFLPWYEKSIFIEKQGRFVPDKLTGFGSADFVMASVVLVALGVLALAFSRGERRAFHLPGGDGTVVAAAGAWAALLIFYRVLDHPSVTGRGATIGIQWGVFVAFLAAALLLVAGLRIRAAHRPEPPLRAAAATPPEPEPRTRRQPARRPPVPDEEGLLPGQMSFDEAETQARRRED